MTIRSEYKTCSNCGSTKKLDKFYVDKARYDGRQGVCSECQRSRHRDQGVVLNNKLLQRWGRV